MDELKKQILTKTMEVYEIKLKQERKNNEDKIKMGETPNVELELTFYDLWRNFKTYIDNYERLQPVLAKEIGTIARERKWQNCRSTNESNTLINNNLSQDKDI